MSAALSFLLLVRLVLIGFGNRIGDIVVDHVSVGDRFPSSADFQGRQQKQAYKATGIKPDAQTDLGEHENVHEKFALYLKQSYYLKSIQ